MVKIGKIEPGAAVPYEAVAPALKKEIATERARKSVGDLRDKMEDERGGGASVVEAAKKLGLNAVTVDAVDRSGRRLDGQLATDIPKGLDVVTQAFGSDVGVDNDPISYQRRLCLVRRARHHPVARAQSRRGQGPGRGEMA